MPLMTWDKTMSVGVSELDDQHQTLIELINEVYEAIQRHDEHAMTTLIAKMRTYAATHFATEEKYMRENDYPDLAGHIEKHQQFIADVDEFQKKLFAKTNLSQLFVYLSRWLTNHIMEQDKRFMSYMPFEEASDTQSSS